MRNLVVISSFLLLLSCKSAFNETLKSRNVEKKEKLAFELYEKEDFYKASDLFKSLIQDKKSGSGIEKMFFYYAMCDYNLGDFGLAAYEFERLIQKFPRGIYTEESQFYVGMSNFKKSPPSFLDQDYTYRAIESFQLFLDKYPNSNKKQQVNNKVEQLTKKLELKMYRQAKLFYQMGEFKSSAVFFDNLLIEFPDTEFAEEVNYLIAESKFKLAKKSIESRQIERYKKSLNAVKIFNNKFKESVYSESVLEIEKRSQNEITKLKKELPEYYHKIGEYDKSISLYETLLRRAKTSSEQNKYALRLFNVFHTKSQKANTQNKVENYSVLIQYYNQLGESNRNFIKTKASKELESAILGYNNYKINAAYLLYKEGKYAHSIAQFKNLIRDTTLKIKSRDWYFFLQANYKLSTSQEAKSRKLQLDTIINYWSEVEKLINISPSGYDAKMKKIKSKTENDLKAFPIALIKEPYDDGKYKLAIVRAQKELEKITKKDEEEIVYLLIASAFKYAKKGKRFERYERFVQTNKLLKLYSFKLKNESLKEKLFNLEGKIKKGLTKYQINEE
jgi:outer membrane protein assembly factor BamD